MKRLQLVVLTAMAAVSLSATTITASLPEYNGGRVVDNFPVAPVTIGTFNYTIPTNEHIVAATFSSTWGNSGFPDTAAVNLYVAGVLVGTCAAGAPCNTDFDIIPFSSTFLPADFLKLSSGSAAVTAIQNGQFALRIGNETLNITTAVNNPEPASIGLFGLGAAALAFLRVRRQRQA